MIIIHFPHFLKIDITLIPMDYDVKCFLCSLYVTKCKYLTEEKKIQKALHVSRLLVQLQPGTMMNVSLFYSLSISRRNSHQLFDCICDYC